MSLMGTLWLWEPEPLQPKIINELSPSQVPIKIAASGSVYYCEQFIVNTFKFAFAQGHRSPFIECIQFVSWVREQIHFGRLQT